MITDLNYSPIYNLLIHILWNQSVDIVLKILDITLFLVRLKSILSKPGLKKARKASQFSKR